MLGIRIPNPLCGPRPSNPSRKSSPAAAEPWSKSSPAVPAPSPESGSDGLSSYFADTTLALYSIGQALVIPNWVAGPSNLVAFAILCALRVRAEERMMVEEFGDAYAAYSARTKRLIPGVW